MCSLANPCIATKQQSGLPVYAISPRVSQADLGVFLWPAAKGPTA